MTRILYNADQLAYAVIGQAARQATGKTTEKADVIKAAREWLLSDDALYLTEPLGLDIVVPEWVRKGCKVGKLPNINKVGSRDWHEYYAKRNDQNEKEK